MPLDTASDQSDDALMLRYANGDRLAARVLTQRLAPRVLSHASRVLNDAAEAEDVTQEALLRLWKTAPNWRPGEAKVSTWLYRVAANLCTDHLRRRRTVGLDQIEEPEDTTPQIVDQMIERDRVRALQTALAKLPERQRQAVVLRHIEGLTNPDIASVLDISVEATESLIARGKRTLKDLLASGKANIGMDQ